MKIKNKLDENLDVSVDGARLGLAEKVIIFAHGFGTDKHERGIFDQMLENVIKSSDDIATVRFSYSGFGESEGNQRTKTLDTMVNDLSSVVDFMEENKNEGATLTLVGYSLGTHIVAKYLSENKASVVKVILISLPECRFKDRMQEFFKSKGLTKVNEDGTWELERADGTTTYVGPDFWESVSDGGKQLANLKKLTENLETYLLRATDDDIVDVKASDEEIRDLQFKEIVYLRGDHNYKSPDDRKSFLEAFVKLVKES